MSKIERLYCTHCTFGTSALETHSADTAGKVLGYSVRASSVDDSDRGRLRQLFRTVERLLSYELPRDTPAGKKESLDASTAPRRLIFLPSLGDCQVVGQISYRARDTAGRPGSYFADILVGEIARPAAGRAGQRSQPAEGHWSPAECLRLWSADHEGKPQGDWWCDSEERFDEQVAEGRGKPVAPAAGLADVRKAGAGADGSKDLVDYVGDAVFGSFLNTPPGGDFDDAGRVIPPRWQNMPVEDRRSLVANLLQATIDLLNSQGRGHVVVAVEPSVAAVLFYGVCQLLPERLTLHVDQTPGISFSTYDPFPERPMTNLAATTFFDVENATNDLPAEVYQRGVAYNTFRQPFKHGKLPRIESYVKHMLQLATDGQELARDHSDEHELLRTLNGLSNLTVSMLDQLVELDRFLAEYTRGVRPWAALSGAPRVPAAGAEAEFLCRRFRTMVESATRQGQSAWPPDLLARAIEWLGEELVAEHGMWSGSQPETYRLLHEMLPTTESALRDFIAPKAGRQPPDKIVMEAAVRVAHATHKLPDCLGEFLATKGEVGPTRFQRMTDRLDRNQLPAILLNSNPVIYADRILTAIAHGGFGLPKPIVARLLEKLLAKILDGGVDQATCWRLLADHSEVINQLEPPIKGELQAQLDRLFGGPGPQSGLRNAPPAVTNPGSLQALDFWAALTTQFSDNQLLLKTWREFYGGFSKLRDKSKGGRGQGFGWGGASKEIRPHVETVAESLCRIRGLRSSMDMERHHVAQCMSLFGSVLEAKGSGVPPDARKQLESLVRQHLDAKQALQEKSRARKAVAGDEKPNKFSRLTIAAAAAAIALALGGGGVAFWWSSRVEESPTPAKGEVASGSKSSAKTEEGEKPSGAKKELPPNQEPKTQKAGKGGERGGTNRLSTADIKFAVEPIKDGQVVVRWEPAIAEKGTCELTAIVSDAAGVETRAPSPSDATKGLHTIDLKSGYGEYVVEIKVTPKGAAPVVQKSDPFDFPQPKPPVVETIGLVVELGTSTPQLVARIKTDERAALYGKAGYKLKATWSGGERVVEPAAMPKPVGDGSVQEVRFAVPDQLSPKDFLDTDGKRATFQLCMNPPAGPGQWSEAKDVQFDAGKEFAEFMRKQVDKKTELNAKGVCQLRPENQTADYVPLVRLPALLKASEIELMLLTPKWVPARPQLTLGRVSPVNEENPSWEVVEKPTAVTSSDTGTPPRQQPTRCGEFYIERDGWQAELRFRQDGIDQTIQSALGRLSYCKLGVVYQPQKAAPRLVALLQLLKPMSHAGRVISVRCNPQGASVAQPVAIPKLVNHPKIDFQSPPRSTNGLVTAECNGKGVSLLMKDKTFATADIDVSPDNQEIKLGQFKWQQPDPSQSPEFPGFPFGRNQIVTLIGDGKAKIREEAIARELKDDRCGVKERKVREEFYAKLRLPLQAHLTPSELVDQLKGVVVDDKDPGFKKYVLSCIERSQKLVERYGEFEEFQKAVQGNKEFKFAPWSIEWRVELPAGAEIEGPKDDYESVGGLVVKAIVCSDDSRDTPPPAAPPKADAAAGAK